MCPFIESALNIETRGPVDPQNTYRHTGSLNTPLQRDKPTLISGFGPVDDQKMEFTVDMFLRQRWNDPRLAFGQRLNNTASNIDTLRDKWEFIYCRIVVVSDQNKCNSPTIKLE